MKTRYIVGLAIALALAVLVAEEALAQSVTGKVVDYHGRPIAGLQVVMLDQGGRTIGATFTDRYGMFRLRGIPTSRSAYRLVVSSGNNQLATRAISVPGDVRLPEPIVVR